MSEPPDVLTVAQVADRLGCCTATVKTRIREGRLPGINLGTERVPSYRVPAVQFAAYLAGTWRPAAKPEAVAMLHRRVV